MLRLLALILLMVFFFRAVGSLIKFLSGGGLAGRSDGRGNRRNGNVRVDQDPQSSTKDGKNFRGGEYVDYEDVK